MTDIPFPGEGERNYQLWNEGRVPAPVFSGRLPNGTNPVAGPYAWTTIGFGATPRLDLWKAHVTNVWSLPRGKSGWYLVCVHGTWSANAAGQRGVRVINKAGQPVAIDETQAAGAGYTQQGVSELIYLPEGDTLAFQAQQLNSAAIVSHQFDASSTGSGMDIIFMGPAA